MRTWNWDSNEFRDLDVDAMLQTVAASAAEASLSEGDGATPETVDDVEQGASFRIKMLIPEELESGDGRKMAKDALSHRDLPIPLLWQPSTGDGHNGSYIVGRIDSIERIDGGLGNAVGVFDTGPYGREAERLVRSKMLRGVSADLDQFEATADGEDIEDLAKIGTEKITVNKARVMAATLVAKPAFQECAIELDDGEGDMGDLPMNMPDGVYEQTPSDEMAAAEVALSSIAASAAPVNPPSSWFKNPELPTPTPLTVDDEGRVFGHIASWETDHIAYNYGVRPPRSRSNYAYFRTGLVRTEEGVDVAVGQLTLAGGHAPLDADAHKAVKHYDDTASAVADVAAGEDAFGIWVSGALRPGVTAEQVRTLRASAPSGDWRPINGALELVAVCQVNVPGFPIARARVASGAVMALVAAGASSLAKIKTNKLEELSTRLEAMERRELERQKAELVSRFTTVKEDRARRLSEAAAAAREKFSPELVARRQKAEELAARAEEARRRIAEFKVGLHVAPNFEENKHPRDDQGRFRTVLFHLTELLKDAAGENPSADAAKASLERAADLEDQGDTEGARRAGEDAKAQLEKASADIADGDQEASSALQDVAQETEDATTNADTPAPDQETDTVPSAAPEAPAAPATETPVVPTDAPNNEPAPSEEHAPGSGLTPDDLNLGDIPPEIMDLMQTLIDNFGEKADPRRIVGAMDARLKAWLEGKGFRSPEDMARVVSTVAKHKVTPGTIQ